MKEENQKTTEIRDNIVFDPEIRLFERKFIDCYVDTGIVRGRSSVLSHILAYLLIHESLTQSDFKTLSNLYFENHKKKGISSGLISKILSELVERKIGITCSKVLGAKNKFIYQINSDVEKLVLNSFQLAVINSRHTISFLSEKIECFQTMEISPFSKTKLSSYRPNPSFAFSRLEKLIDCHKQDVKNISALLKLPVSKPKKVQQQKRKNIHFSGDFCTFISEIIQYLANSLQYMNLKSDYRVLFIFFILYEELTQESLREITLHFESVNHDSKIFTGMSAGAISLGLNYLLELGVISRFKKPNERRYYYQMESVSYSHFYFLRESIQSYFKWIPTMEDWLKELSERAPQLQARSGYNRMVKIITQFLNLKEFLSSSLEFLNNELET
ncbi:hypothetical protein NEF87_001076 [Candidatus Lokiarchaeum ossiferum]|uniref:Uncharacterized protein n=1 Tax=Candidatus Lokiarchaeum ossiferum TaxID=2951803 RepID=A0ABY6HQF4_9ARCH|nr:hypothetical protein NEF87_001076 [Candidatus Lokiarchaeum sp. B-35]